MGTLSTILQQVRGLMVRHETADQTDGRLLDDFLTRRDQTAFEALVARHGAMVLGVCCRVLQDPHEAEDAFQATFLVLVRKGTSIVPRELVGNWLYGVAYRTSLKARAAMLRRRTRERQVSAMPPSEASTDPVWSDLQPVLDQELHRLPDQYRVPVVLCALEGRSREEVARLLGIPEGTLSSRLARGRELLGQRLTRRGLAFSAPALAALLSAHTASALVPAPLVIATVQAAALATASEAVAAGIISAKVAALTEGVIQAMFIAKLKVAAVIVMAVGVMATGVGVMHHQAMAEKPAALVESSDQAPVPPEAAAEPVATPVKEVKEVKEAEDVKPDKKPAAPMLAGTVVAVAADKGTITFIVSKDKQQSEQMLALAKDVKVLLYEGKRKGEEPKEGKLADVTEGTVVVLQLSDDQKTVVSIRPQPQSMVTTFKSADADKITVTFKSKKGQEEVVLTVDKDAKVLLNDGLKKGTEDKEGKLADLTEGTPVHLQLSVYDRKLVQKVRVLGRGMSGSVVGVDAGNNQITISMKEDGQIVEKTLPVSKDVRMEGKLADLVQGTNVNVTLSVFDQKTVVGISTPKPK